MNSSSEIGSDEDEYEYECSSCSGIKEASHKDASIEQGLDALEQSIVDCLEDEDMTTTTTTPTSGHDSQDGDDSYSHDSGFFQARKMPECCGFGSVGQRAYTFLKKNPGICNIKKLRIILGEKYKIFEQKLPNLIQDELLHSSDSSETGRSQYAWRTLNDDETSELDRLMCQLVYIYITVLSASAELSFINESETTQVKLAKVHICVRGKSSFKIFFIRLEITETSSLYDAILTIYYFTRVLRQPYRYPLLQLFTAFDTLVG